MGSISDNLLLNNIVMLKAGIGDRCFFPFHYRLVSPSTNEAVQITAKDTEKDTANDKSNNTNTQIYFAV